MRSKMTIESLTEKPTSVKSAAKNRQTDFPLEDGKKRQRDQNVVENGDNRARRVCPVVAKSNKKQNPDQSEKRRDNGLVTKLRAGDRTDRIGSDDFVSGRFDRPVKVAAPSASLPKVSRAFLTKQRPGFVESSGHSCHVLGPTITEF